MTTLTEQTSLFATTPDVYTATRQFMIMRSLTHGSTIDEWVLAWLEIDRLTLMAEQHEARR